MTGEAVSLAGPGAVVLTTADMPEDLLRDIGVAVREPGAGAALAALATRAGGRIRALAAYAVEGGAVRLLALGAGSVVGVDAAGERHAVGGEGGPAVGELVVAGLVEVVLAGGSDVPVRSVHYLGTPPPGAEPAAVVPELLPDPAPAAALPSFDPPAFDPPVLASDDGADPMGTQVFADGDLAAAEGAWVPPRFDGTMTGEYDFAHLIDGGSFGGVEAAAVRAEPEPESAEDLLALPAWDAPASPSTPIEAPASPALGGPAAGWAPPPLLGRDPTPAVGAAAPPSFGPIVTGPEPVEPGSGPKVQSVACPSGHLNHPAAPVCRVCGSAIIDRSVVWAHRPSLGRLRFDDGMLVDLDRSLVIGRRPSTAGRPGDYGLVTVADPDASISRSHAELVIEDWQVVVTDLGSTNGTVVEAPGEDPVRLRADVPHVVGPGVRVMLGGAVGFEITQPTS